MSFALGKNFSAKEGDVGDGQNGKPILFGIFRNTEWSISMSLEIISALIPKLIVPVSATTREPVFLTDL